MSRSQCQSQISRLRAAAHDLLAIAEELERGDRQRAAPSDMKQESTIGDLAALAARIHSVRDLRKEFFSEQLFGEPAWDMLLYLFMRIPEDCHVQKKALQNASGVPPTTALRWIEVLEQAGLIESNRCPSDNRVTLINLTKEGQVCMAGCLDRSLQSRRLHFEQKG